MNMESAILKAGPKAGKPGSEDRDMIRTAAMLTRDLNAAKPSVYYADLLLSALIGYAGVAVAILSPSPAIAWVAAIVAVLALYRAASFIHEITHIKQGAVPAFRLVWNMLIGVPLLVPSFMYEGIHNLHHSRTRYGTAEDPEYLPLALMKPWTVPLFVVASALAPIALLFRYGILGPLTAFIPPLRRIVVERYSGLVINPAFRRKEATGEQRRNWLWQEAGASIWAIFLIAGTAFGYLPLNAVIIFLAIASGAVVLNQIRTLVAHLWANEGEVLSITDQYLDSVNVPPPGLLPALWAPVGLRYLALHHLLPGVPYHALGEAHRRITKALPEASAYHRGNYKSLSGLVVNLVKGTMHSSARS